MINTKHNFQKLFFLVAIIASQASHAQVIDLRQIFKQVLEKNNSEQQKNIEENKPQAPIAGRDFARFKPGSIAYVEKLTQYQNQVPSIPVTAEGYTLFQKLNSEFLDLTGNRKYVDAMLADDALGGLQNKVADIFIKRRPEYKGIESQAKKEQFSQGEKNREALTEKYKNQIQKLGFSQPFLEATIFLQEANQKSRKFMKFKDYVAILLDSGKYKLLQRATVKRTEGVLLKVEGEPSKGVTFRKDSDELYAAYFIDSSGDASEIDEVSQGSVSVYLLKSIAE